MVGRPGTPRLLREINDRAALELLLAEGPLTRAQLGERTGLSKVTASQTLLRLEERGLVAVTGQQAGGRGPSAAVYAVVPTLGYVAGLHVEHDGVSAGVADVTGRVLAEVSVDPNGAGDPVGVVRGAVARACQAAGVGLARLSALVIGAPGVLDPSTGDPRLAVNLPAWHEGVLAALRTGLGKPVTIQNDVNLAAVAEHEAGAARGAADFALVWLGTGLGLAAVLGGRLHQGVRGAAGEIGYLPVPGVPLPEDLTRPAAGGFRSLAGGAEVMELAARNGFAAPAAGEAVRTAMAALTAGSPDAAAFAAELARRVAIGVAAIAVTLDPGLVVLGGEVGQAGGDILAARVADEVGRICPVVPSVVATAVPDAPVLRGALLAAVAEARAGLLASVGDD
ncbi:MAG: ROK family transcriptional regulator [Actinobacteria bacterium]|nr:ROK family transcriptional regulator [Actinomycetota bacterium]